MAAGLRMDGYNIRPQTGKRINVALRVLHHQVHVKNPVRNAPDAGQHRHAEGYAGHKQPVHHINMNILGAAPVRRFYVGSQMFKIRR